MTRRMRIAEVARVRSSGNGNPRYAVTFTDGTSARTVADGQISHYAENSEWVGVDLDVEFTAAGEIRGWTLA